MSVQNVETGKLLLYPGLTHMDPDRKFIDDRSPKYILQSTDSRSTGDSPYSHSGSFTVDPVTGAVTSGSYQSSNGPSPDGSYHESSQNYEASYTSSLPNDSLLSQDRVDSILSTLEPLLVDSLNQFDQHQGSGSGYLGTNEDLIGENRRYLYETTELKDEPLDF